VTIVLLIIFSIAPLSQNVLHSVVTSAEVPSFVGVWKGDSVCQIKDSPCHDEASVYYVSKGAESSSFQMKMNKMVDGKEETMGNVNCKAGSDNRSYVCRLMSLQRGRGASIGMCSTETFSTAGSSTARFT
jgi:hypothetical protein